MASGLKTEFAKHLVGLNVSTFSMAPVKVWKINLTFVFLFGHSNLLVLCRLLYIKIAWFCNVGTWYRGVMHLSALTYLTGRIMLLRSIIHSRYYSLRGFSNHLFVLNMLVVILCLCVYYFLIYFERGNIVMLTLFFPSTC